MAKLDESTEVATEMVLKETEARAVTDAKKTTEEGAPQIHENIANNVSFTWELGDRESTDAAFDGAVQTAELELRNSRLIPHAIEPRATLADFDLLASDAFMLLGSHLLSGRVNPETIHSEWLANRRGADFAAVLDTALSGRGVAVTLEGLLPPQPGYARLRSALRAKALG